MWFPDRDAIKAMLAEFLRDKPTAEWLAMLEPADIWCARGASTGHSSRTSLVSPRSSRFRRSSPPAASRCATTRCPIRMDGRALKSTPRRAATGPATAQVMEEFGLSAGRGREETRMIVEHISRIRRRVPPAFARAHHHRSGHRDPCRPDRRLLSAPHGCGMVRDAGLQAAHGPRDADLQRRDRHDREHDQSARDVLRL